MELVEPKPKPKKHHNVMKSLPLPLVFKKDGSMKKISGTFNGFSVVIKDMEDMKILSCMGYFGKANFSRNYPQFGVGGPEILRERQFKNRKMISEKLGHSGKPERAIVVPDSDSDSDNYFTNLKPTYELDKSGLKENLCLSLEEAFFLASSLKCLNVSYNGAILSSQELWPAFSKHPTFVRNYIVYYYYRCKNWVVKPGIKFGCDFILYKQGPPFYHASYVVIIDVVNENMERNINLTKHPMDNIHLSNLQRLSEAAGKELLICKIIWPLKITIDFENLSNISIQEILARRWIPNHEREEN